MRFRPITPFAHTTKATLRFVEESLIIVFQIHVFCDMFTVILHEEATIEKYAL
jgi:hypothetical protein